ncbi:hypothetical protein H4W31_003840 [Plantactinospora soyae]|uniref:Uncharacterized protein n=1 Tax=Plantactinospora soyae TaxID=1544732 RepID=A0A927M717_9ACTN|nr:hypothetical protein [Plantactinospora soyae]
MTERSEGIIQYSRDRSWRRRVARGNDMTERSEELA